jgi:hypothetical protein
MLYFVTAKPGSGKTQYVIERFILDLIKENEAEIAAWKPSEEQPAPPLRRQVFANINGLDVAAVQARVGGLRVLPAPDDWRECPDGSVVIYDEAQQEHLFPATGKPGLTDDARIARLDTHRHRGFDIVLVSQDPALVHHWARKFVNCHIHLSRPSGAELMNVRQWTGVQSNPDDFFVQKDADTHTRRMDKTVWKLYKSATVHTHKFAMPKGAKYAIRVFLALCVIIPLGFLALAMFTMGGAKAEAQDQGGAFSSLAPLVPGVTAPALSSSVAYAWRDAAPVEPINGCAAGRHCRCWDFEGKVVDMEESACRNLAEGISPMPIDLNLFRNERRDGREEGESRVGAAPAPLPSTAAGVGTQAGAVGNPQQGHVWGNSPNGG